ncbi:hypothetical protein XU18_1951 [Perkinsela sp. CCAP 1560/4]|nr:hypothetical protein XU18_1951 [Perkinsela sp. CCAP 1560/4]|eukprot:KNH07419.1 hypothetical protein XU18_1951 [Perkinsela sp. CCAP 1560/4]
MTSRRACIRSSKEASMPFCAGCRPRKLADRCVVFLCLPGVKPRMFNLAAIRKLCPGFGCTSPSRKRREIRLMSLTASMRTLRCMWWTARVFDATRCHQGGSQQYRAALGFPQDSVLIRPTPPKEGHPSDKLSFLYSLLMTVCMP